MKRILSYLLLVSFVCQIGNSVAIGNIIENLINKVYSFYSDDSGLSFFDSVFQDGICESEQNEEEAQKKLGNDLFYKTVESNSISNDFEGDEKSYLTFSELIPSGFYFSLIQPPD